MPDDELSRTTSSIDTRLTWTVNLWGAAITIVVGMIWSYIDHSPTSVSQLPLTVPMHKDSMMLLRACRHDEDQEELTPCQFFSLDLTAKII